MALVAKCVITAWRNWVGTLKHNRVSTLRELFGSAGELASGEKLSKMRRSKIARMGANAASKKRRARKGRAVFQFRLTLINRYRRSPVGWWDRRNARRYPCRHTYIGLRTGPNRRDT